MADGIEISRPVYCLDGLVQTVVCYLGKDPLIKVERVPSVPQLAEPLNVLVDCFSWELVDTIQVRERSFVGPREELCMEALF